MLYDSGYNVARQVREPRLVRQAPGSMYGRQLGPGAGPLYGQPGPYARYQPRPAPAPAPEPRGLPQFAVIYTGSVPLGPGTAGLQASEPNVEDVAGVVDYVKDRTDAMRREGTRLKTYLLQIGIDKVAFRNIETSDVQHIPTSQIHFVAADPRHPNIFSLVARGRGNRFLCHVFECNSFKQCDLITRTVSEAFRIAYESWARVEENQRRLEERRTREMDMGGLEYFQEWDDHAPRGMPLYNLSSYYNSGQSRPRQYLQPRDEMPSLPERLVLSRSNQGGSGNREPNSQRYNFEDEYDDEPQEEVYVRQDQPNGRRGRQQQQQQQQQQLVYDIRPDWE